MKGTAGESGECYWEDTTLTAWQEVKKDLVKLWNEAWHFAFKLSVCWLIINLVLNFLNLNEEEGSVDTQGCRIVVTHKKRPLFDSGWGRYTCVYERTDPKNPDTVTSKICTRVTTENGFCTKAEVYYDTK